MWDIAPSQPTSESDLRSAIMHWRELYCSAVWEAEPALSKQKAPEAEKAVRLRLNELRNIPDCSVEDEEERDLQTTLYALEVLPWAEAP
jgi:hypothetical protein